jgi:Ca2+/Na+ antiporter
VVIGFTALVKRVHLQWQPVVRDGTVYALVVILLGLLIRDGTFSARDGGVLVASYILYLVILFLWSKFIPENKKKTHWQQDSDRLTKQDDDSGTKKSVLARLANRLDPFPDPRRRPIWTIPLFLFSLAIIGGGTYIFLRSGESIATFLGIDSTIVALTIIAGGSSIPELISSAIVARRGKGDMAIANAMGSNTFDICIGLGLPVLLATLIHGPVKNVGGANIKSTTILLLATLLMVLGLLVMRKFKADRPFGILLVLIYICYVLAAFLGWIA